MTDPSISLDVRPPEIQQPGQVLGQYANLRNLANQGQLQQQQIVGAGQENQMRATQIAQMKTINDAYKSALTVGPDGSADIDTGKLASAMAQGNAGSQIAPELKPINDYKKSIVDLAKIRSELNVAQQDAGGMLGLSAKDNGYDPRLFLTGLQHARDAKAIDPGVVQPAIAQIQQSFAQDPTGASAKTITQKFADGLIGSSQKAQQILNQRMTAQGAAQRGQAALGNANREQAQADFANTISDLAGAPPKDVDAYVTSVSQLKPEIAKRILQAVPPSQYDPQKSPAVLRQLAMTPEQQTQADQAAANAAQTKLYEGKEVQFRGQQVALEAARLRQEAANRETMTLTPEARDQMATYFATTGQLPSLGMGASAGATRSQIINRAAEMFPNVAFASNAASYQANKSSLKNVAGTLDTLSAFENSGLKNLKMFTDAAAKIPDTGVPWLNTPVRLLSDKLIGNDNMAVVNAARTIGLREIARVTNDPKLSGVLSDSARQEVQAFSPSNATLPQILAVAKTLQQDMANVHSSLQTQKEAIEQRIGVNPQAASGTPAPAFKVGDSVMYNGTEHKVTAIKPDGKLVLDGGK